VHAKTPAARIVAAPPKDPSGTKALAAGQQVTSTIVLPEVVPAGRPALYALIRKPFADTSVRAG